MAQPTFPGRDEYLLARACIARSLVREKTLNPLDALALTVWPTAELRVAEARVNRNTLASRAYSMKLNA